MEQKQIALKEDLADKQNKMNEKQTAIKEDMVARKEQLKAKTELTVNVGI